MHAHWALSYRNHIVYSNTVISRDKLLYVSVGGVCEENFGQLWARKGEKGMMWVLTYVTPRY